MFFEDVMYPDNAHRANRVLVLAQDSINLAAQLSIDKDEIDKLFAEANKAIQEAYGRFAKEKIPFKEYRLSKEWTQHIPEVLVLSLSMAAPAIYNLCKNSFSKTQVANQVEKLAVRGEVIAVETVLEIGLPRWLAQKATNGLLKLAKGAVIFLAIDALFSAFTGDRKRQAMQEKIHELLPVRAKLKKYAMINAQLKKELNVIITSCEMLVKTFSDRAAVSKEQLNQLLLNVGQGSLQSIEGITDEVVLQQLLDYDKTRQCWLNEDGSYTVPVDKTESESSEHLGMVSQVEEKRETMTDSLQLQDYEEEREDGAKDARVSLISLKTMDSRFYVPVQIEEKVENRDLAAFAAACSVAPPFLVPAPSDSDLSSISTFTSFEMLDLLPEAVVAIGTMGLSEPQLIQVKDAALEMSPQDERLYGLSWGGVLDIFNGDTYYPDNPHRQRRAEELVADCNHRVAELTRLDAEIKKLATQLSDELREKMRDEARMPEELKLVSVGEESKAFKTILLLSELVSTALLYKGLRLLNIPGAGFLALLGGVGIGVGVAAIEGSVKRDRLREVIHECFSYRQSLEKFYLVNKSIHEGIDALLDSKQHLSSVFPWERLVETLKKEVTDVLVTAKARGEDYEITLATLDEARHSWTKEDPRGDVLLKLSSQELEQSMGRADVHAGMSPSPRASFFCQRVPLPLRSLEDDLVVSVQL